MEDKKVVQFNRVSKPKLDNGSSKKGYSLYNEGLCFYNKDKDSIALEKFLLAEKEGYESADMFGYMAFLYYSVFPDSEKAKSYIRKAIKTDRNYGYPYRLMALVYDEEKDYKMALKYNLMAEANKYDTNPAMMRHIAELYSKLDVNNMLKSIEYATKAIDLDPKNAYNWYFKGWIYYIENEFGNALKFFKKAEEMGLVESDCYFEMSYAYGELGNHKKAIEYANKCIFVDKDSYSGYYRKGYAYWLCDNYDKALEAFLIAEKKDCTCADMYSRMAYIYVEKLQYDVALSYTKKALKLDKKEGDAYYIQSSIYALGYYDYKTSLKILKKAKKIYESKGDVFNPEAYCHLISFYSAFGKRKLALEIAEEALEFYPENPHLMIMKAYALQSKKRYYEAEQILKDFYSMENPDSFIRTNLIVTAYNRKKEERDYDLVLSLLDNVTELEFDDKKLIKSFCYYEKKEYEKGFQFLYEFSENVNIDAFHEGNIVEFKKYYNRYLKKFPNDERIKIITKKFKKILNKKSSK